MVIWVVGLGVGVECGVVSGRVGGEGVSGEGWCGGGWEGVTGGRKVGSKGLF